MTRLIIHTKLPIDDFVWNLIKSKLGNNLNVRFNEKSKSWSVKEHKLWAPAILIFFPRNNEYFFRDHTYSEKEFLRVLNLLAFT